MEFRVFMVPGLGFRGLGFRGAVRITEPKYPNGGSRLVDCVGARSRVEDRWQREDWFPLLPYNPYITPI